MDDKIICCYCNKAISNKGPQYMKLHMKNKVCTKLENYYDEQLMKKYFLCRDHPF